MLCFEVQQGSSCYLCEISTAGVEQRAAQSSPLSVECMQLRHGDSRDKRRSDESVKLRQMDRNGNKTVQKSARSNTAIRRERRVNSSRQ